MDNAKKIDLCFAELIGRRAWYKATHDDRRLANLHKRQFHAGELTDEKKREYLKDAGYIMAQPEMWIKP